MVTVIGTLQNSIGFSFNCSKSVTFTGDSVTATFDDPNAVFVEVVLNAVLELEWTVCETDVTPTHAIYITAGTPTGSVVTVTRISRLTKDCDNLASEPDIIEALWTKVAEPAKYQLGAMYPSPVWKILDGTPGECIAIADLFEKTIQLIGLALGDGTVVFCYVDPGGGSHESTSTSDFAARGCQWGQNGHDPAHGPTHGDENALEKLIWMDRDGGLNNWEACFKYREDDDSPYKYYAAGTGGDPPYDSAQGVMDAYAVSTLWQYCRANWTPIGNCSDPGPNPENGNYPTGP